MTQEWTHTAQALYSVKEQLKSLKAQESQIAQRLRDLSGNKTAHDGAFVYKKDIRKGAPDYQLIVKQYSIDVELFRKPDTEQWRLIQL